MWGGSRGLSGGGGKNGGRGSSQQNAVKPTVNTPVTVDVEVAGQMDIE